MASAFGEDEGMAETRGVAGKKDDKRYHDTLVA